MNGKCATAGCSYYATGALALAAGYGGGYDGLRRAVIKGKCATTGYPYYALQLSTAATTNPLAFLIGSARTTRPRHARARERQARERQARERQGRHSQGPLLHAPARHDSSYEPARIPNHALANGATTTHTGTGTHAQRPGAPTTHSG